jgi:hypothetical protein
MQTPKLRDVPLSVSELRVRIDQWRATRKKGDEMPEGLWIEAAQLTRNFGLNPVASALRLNYYALKERAADLPAAAAAPAVRPTFVAIDAPPLIPSGCIIEAEHAGEKLTIRVSGSAPLDVLSLLQAFWSRRR